MDYIEVLIKTENSIRQLAKDIGLPWTTLRDRLNNTTPLDKRRNRVSKEVVMKAEKLLLSGLSIREAGKILGIPKSTLHDQVIRYRGMLNEESN